MTEFVTVSAMWVMALGMFVVNGAGVMRLLGVNSIEGRPLYQLLLQFLIGMALVNTILGLISLFYPITLNTTIIIGGLSLAMLIDKGVRGVLVFSIKGISDVPWFLRIVFFGLLALVMLSTLLPSLNYDTGLYHHQFIMWMNRYPVVPGLANLHERFGFNSHWHLLAAGFNGYPYLTKLLNDLGGLLTVVMLLAWIESIGRLIKNRWSFFDGIMVLFILPFYLLARFLTSDTPDLPNAAIGFVLLSVPFCVEITNRSRLFFMAIIGGLLVTVKVSSVLLLISALPAVLKSKPINIILAVLVGFVVLTPWMLRTYQMSGYLVYPAKFTAVGTPDFQAPEASLNYVNALLESHGKFGRYDVNLVGRPVNEWAAKWLSHQTTAIKLILAFCFLLVVPMLIYDSIKSVKSNWEYRPTLDVTIHLAFLMSMAIVFKLAPEIRYGYGSLLFYFIFLLLKSGVDRSKWMQLGLCVVGAFMFARIVSVVRTEEPAPVLTKTYQVMEGSALPIFYPNEFDQCWEHELPCTNRYIDGLEMRSNKLEDGFTIVNYR